MGSLTKTTRAILALFGSKKDLRQIPPNAAAGSTPTPPANQFGGFQEHVPERVFVSTAGTQGFLQSSNRFYTFFGLQPQNVNSIEHLLEILGNPANTTKYLRILLVSHAHPRGMIIPFFTGGVNGTNKEVFREFAKSDLDGLKLLNPFNPPIFNWGSVFSSIMANIRTFMAQPTHPQFADALKPFGLQTSGTPSGKLREFFEECFDFVFIATPGRIKNNAGGNITSEQRNIFIQFIGEIINQIGKKIINTTIGTQQITAAHISTLQSALTQLSINDLNVGTHNYPLSDYGPGNMNYYPTLENAARAVRGDFRKNLDHARQRFFPDTAIDIRGCRAGEDSEYLTSLREFFDRPASPRLRVSAPSWFQSYPPLGWEQPRNRADIAGYLSKRIFAKTLTPDDQRKAVQAWAKLIKVDPLHTNFWSTLFDGAATAFCGLDWRSTVPALFIPTPGVRALATLDFATLVRQLSDYFNVPAASMPTTAQLTAIQPLLASLPTLLVEVSATTMPTRLLELYNGLKQINANLGQSFVPADAPQPLKMEHIQEYQRALVKFLETNNLAPIKTFLTEAKQALENRDGLYHYMLFAGLPVFFFDRFNFINHNGLMVLQAHGKAALQSWYKCMWAESLPNIPANASTGAAIDQENARRAPMLQDDHQLTELAICPASEYGDHIRLSQG